MLRLTFVCPWSYRHPVIADLDVEHNELAQTWKTFVRHLPPSSRVERGDRPPSVDDVVALVRNTQSFWRSQPRHRVFGEASALCDKFVPTLNTHATLLAVLPDADLFHAPLFYSVLQTVIKVGWTDLLSWPHETARYCCRANHNQFQSRHRQITLMSSRHSSLRC